MPRTVLAEAGGLLIGGAVFLLVLAAGHFLGGDEPEEKPERPPDPTPAPPATAPAPGAAPAPKAAPAPAGGSPVRAWRDLFPEGDVPSRPEFLESAEQLFLREVEGEITPVALGSFRVADMTRHPDGARVTLRASCIHGEAAGGFQVRIVDLHLFRPVDGFWTLERHSTYSEEALPPLRPQLESPSELPQSVVQEDLHTRLARLRRQDPGFSLLATQEEVRGLCLDLRLARARGDLSDAEGYVAERLLDIERFWLEHQKRSGQQGHLDDLRIERADLVRIEDSEEGPVLTYHLVAAETAYLTAADGQVLRGKKDAVSWISEYWTLLPPLGDDDGHHVVMIEPESFFYAWDRSMRKDSAGRGMDLSASVGLDDMAMPVSARIVNPLQIMGGGRGRNAALQRLAQFRVAKADQLAAMEMDASSQMVALVAEAQAENTGGVLAPLMEKVPGFGRLAFLRDVMAMVSGAHRARVTLDWGGLAPSSEEFRQAFQALPRPDEVVSAEVHVLEVENVETARPELPTIVRVKTDVLEGSADGPRRVRYDQRLTLERSEGKTWRWVDAKLIQRDDHPTLQEIRRPLPGLVAERALYDPGVELQKATFFHEGILEAAARIEAFVLSVLGLRTSAWESGDTGVLGGICLPEVRGPLADRIAHHREKQAPPPIGAEELELIDLVRIETEPEAVVTVRLVTRGPAGEGSPRGKLYSEYWSLVRDGGWKLAWIEQAERYLA